MPTLYDGSPLSFLSPKRPRARELFGCTKHFFYRTEMLLLIGCDAIQLSAVLVSIPFVFYCQQVLLCILHRIFLSVTKDFCVG